MKSIKSDQRKFSNDQKKAKKRIIKDTKNEHEIQVRSRGASLIKIPSGYVARQNKTTKVNIVKPINVGNRESEMAVDYMTLSSKSVTSRSTKEFLKNLEKSKKSNTSESDTERLGHKVFQEIEQGLYKNQLTIKKKSPRDKEFTRNDEDTNRSRFYRNLSSGRASHSFSSSNRPRVSHIFSVETDNYSSKKPNISKCDRWLRECSKSEIKEKKEQKQFASKMVRITDSEEQVDKGNQTSDSDEYLDTSSESNNANCSNSRSSASTRVSILKNKGTSKKLMKTNQSKVSSLKCELKSKTFTRKWSNKFQSCSILPSINESKENFTSFEDISYKFDVNGLKQASIPATNNSNPVQDQHSSASSILNFERSRPYDKALNLKPKMPGYFKTKKRYSSTDLPKNKFTSNRSELNSDSDDSKLKIAPGYVASILKKSSAMRKEINTSGSDMSGLLSDEEPAKKLSKLLMKRKRTLQALQDCQKKTLTEKKINQDSSKNNCKLHTINRKDNSFSSFLHPREEQRINKNTKNSEKKSFQLEMEEINKKLELTMSSDVFKSVNYNPEIFKLLEGEHQPNRNKSDVSSPKFKSFLPEIPVLSVLTPIPEEVPLQNFKEYQNMHKICDEETSDNSQKEFTGIKLKEKETKMPTINKVIEKRVLSPLKIFENDRITTNDGTPALLFNKAGFPLTDSKGRCLKNNLGVKMLPASSLMEIIDKKLQVYDAFNYPPTTISFDPTKQALPAQLHDIRIFDKQFKPRVLYNSLGYPLSDKEGFLLRDNLGNYLVVLDNQGIPMCCANGEPIYMDDGKLWITEKESYDVLHRASEVSSFKQNEKRSVTINSEVKSVVYDTKRKATNLGPETSEKIKLDKSTLNYYKNLPNNFVAREKPKPRIIDEVRKRVAKRKEKKAEKNRNKTATSSEDTQKSSRKVLNKVSKCKKLSANFKKYLSLKKNFLKITSALPDLSISEDSEFLTDVDDFTNHKKITKKKQKVSPKIEKKDNLIRNEDSTNHWKESNSYVLNLFLKQEKDKNNQEDYETSSKTPKKETYDSKNDEKMLSSTIKDLNKNKLFSQKNSKDAKIDLAYVTRLKRARKDLNNAFDKLVTRKKSKETYSESDPDNEFLDREWIKLMHDNAENNSY